MPSLRLFPAAAAALFAVAAFAFVLPLPAADTTAHKNGYLQDYHRLNHVGGVPLEQVWIEPYLDVQQYRTLYVAPVQIDPLAYRFGGEADHQIAQRLAKTLRANMVKQLQGAGIFAIVSDDPYYMTRRDHQALILEMRITEVNSGSAARRRFPQFGAGATELQLEGKLIAPKSCRTLFEFADRQLNAGAAGVIGRAASADSEYLLSVSGRFFIDGITKLFIYLREEGPPHNQR